MQQEHWAILLAILGFLLLASEIFIPSGGFIFLMAFGCFVGAVWCAWEAWWVSSPTLFWMFSGGVVVLVPVMGVFMLRYWSKKMAEAEAADKLLMKPNIDTHLDDLVGQMGHAVTPLTPGGLVQVEGERVHASSEGMIVERGESVRVISVEGNRLIVRMVDPGDGSQPADFDEVVDGDTDDPLDFEVSEG